VLADQFRMLARHMDFLSPNEQAYLLDQKRVLPCAVEVGRDGEAHAGELAGPPSVRGALDTLGAQRIAHGVRAVEDPRLVERLVDEQIVLDVCPTSNLMLSVVTGLDEHPLPHLLAAGVRFTLNGDDPLFFGRGLLGEYELARRELALSDEQLALVARYSLEGSGAPDALVKWGIRQIDRWLTS
jgi:adenosine deaminase